MLDLYMERIKVKLYIGDNYKITHSSPNYLVQRKSKKTWVTQAYCATLESALMWIARRRLNEIKGDFFLDNVQELCYTMDQQLEIIKQEIRDATTNSEGS